MKNKIKNFLKPLINTNDFIGLFDKVYGQVTYAYLKQYNFIRLKFHVIGIIAFFGFPLFYYVWKTLYPQPYENFFLRILGAILSIPLIFYNKIPKKIECWMPLYSYLFTIYALPFFFSFMLYMNKGSFVWQMSFICSIFYIVLLLDSLNIIISLVLGFALAVFIIFLIEPSYLMNKNIYLPTLPIAGFSVVGGLYLSHSDEHIRYQRMLSVAAIGSSIAHEMRTPFLGISFNAEGLKTVVPRLIKGYKRAIQNGWSDDQDKVLSNEQIEKIPQAIERIEKLTFQANRLIDIMLMNISDTKIEKLKFNKFSMQKVTESSLATYPFRAGERELINIENDKDFYFRGSDLLVTHVFYNLIKNALRAIADKGEGFITIRLTTEKGKNIVLVEDTGTGIPKDQTRYIFERFYSTKSNGQGVGIGLHFCRRVIESMDGTITCESKLGLGTTFKITLPIFSDTKEGESA